MINSRDLPLSVRDKLGIKARGSKYRNKKTVVDGIKFDSAKEAKRYQDLVALRKAEKVAWFIMQPQFRLPGGTKYRADFLVVWNELPIRVTVEDVKGMKTDVYKIKKREVEHQYGIQISEI